MSERKGRGVAELLAYQGPYFTAEQVGKAMGWSPDGIRKQAQEDPSKLYFRVIVIKKRVYIPRIPFLEYIGLLQEGKE